MHTRIQRDYCDYFIQCMNYGPHLIWSYIGAANLVRRWCRMAVNWGVITGVIPPWKSSVDHALNVVVSGVAENRRSSEWRDTIVQGLAVSAGRCLSTWTLSTRANQTCCRQASLDLVLSSSRALVQHYQSDFIRKMLIAPDEPLEALPYSCWTWGKERTCVSRW